MARCKVGVLKQGPPPLGLCGDRPLMEMSRESLVPSSSASAKAQPPPPGPPFAAAAKATDEPSSLLLAPHAACVSVDASAPHEAELAPAAAGLVDHDTVRQARAAAIRTELLAFYEDTKQTTQVSEMTLRIDTELELLRQQCFAERNARWQYATPEAYTFVPRADWIWQPPTLLARRGVNGVLGRDGAGLSSADKDEHKESSMTLASHTGGSFGKTGKDTPRGEFARDRPWPPREFALKPTIKPTRGRGGKRKAAIVVTEEEPIVAKMCSACHTQRTSLWRTRLVPAENAKLAVSNGVPSGDAVAAATVTTASAPVANGTPAEGTAAAVAAPETPAMKKEVLCMTCYLKLERVDLFERKREEKKRREREERERVAAAALQEKKRLQQQVQMLRKQQQQQKRKLAQVQTTPEAMVAEAAPVFSSVVEPHAATETGDGGHESSATSRRSKSADSKKDKKKGRKDKKKKKKKQQRRHADELDDSESDCLTPMPSPSQMDGKYEYADLAPLSSRSASSTGSFNHEQETKPPPPPPEPSVQQPEPVQAAEPKSSSKRSRDSSRSSTSSSKRRKNSTASVGPTSSSPKEAAPTPVASSSRAARAKAVTAPTPPTPTLVVVPAAANKKRARTKKETARERELRAKGQYCPVCNAVYEDDDESSFVCCDSCEMWVHAACDPSLTPYVAVALAFA